MFRSALALLALPLVTLEAREIVFPPVSGYVPRYGAQHQLSGDGAFQTSDDDVTIPGTFSGLMSFANLPYVSCLKGIQAGAASDDEKFDIAILGAPFDTVRTLFLDEIFRELCRKNVYFFQGHNLTPTWQGTTARPGARFGPSGIRAGSRRIHPDFSWDVYTGERHTHFVQPPATLRVPQHRPDGS